MLRIFTKGINKPGGAAFITAVNYETKTYNVKYIVGGGRDTNVPAEFLTEFLSETVPARFGRRIQENRVDAEKAFEDRALKQVENERAQCVTGYSRSKRKLKPLCVLATLSDDDTPKSLNEFLNFFSANSSSIFSPDVTHLVVQTDAKKVVSQRTMKYLKAVTGKMYCKLRFVCSSLY